MDNNKQTDLQFTPLTFNDVTTHEDLYIDLIVKPHGWAEYWEVKDLGVENRSLLQDYNLKELRKAKRLFWDTFK